MGDRHDYVALEWVKGEIAETLKQARQALEAFVENTQDPTRMRFCLTYIHQVHGTLQMVEFYGAALLAEEMEQLAQALMDGRVSNQGEALEVMMQAILQLPVYLDRIQTARRDLPMVLLPLLNDLRAARGEKLLSETSLFAPDLSGQAPALSHESLAQLRTAELPVLLRKLRQMLQVALVGVIRNQDLATNLGYMARVFARLESLCKDAPLGALWQIASGLVEGLANGSVVNGTSVRTLLRQVDKELKRLLEQGAEGFNQGAPEELTKNLLFYVAKAPAESPRIRTLKAQYRLDDALPDREVVDEERARLAGPDRDAMRSVVTALCEELVRIKDSLDIFVRGDRQQVAELDAQLAPLKQIADTLAVLGFAQPRKVILDQIDVVHGLSLGQREPSDAVLMDVAGALLYVEATLAGMVGPANDNRSEQSHLPTTDVAQIHQLVIKEARNGLEQGKDAIIEFIASQWNHEHLARVPNLLTQVRGGLAMIPLPRAAALLEACNRYIQEELLVRKAVPDWQSLDTLADAITSVEYYLERLAEDHATQGDLILDVAEDSLRALGYGLDPTPSILDEVEDEAPAPLADPLQDLEVLAAEADELEEPLPERDPESLAGPAPLPNETLDEVPGLSLEPLETPAPGAFPMDPWGLPETSGATVDDGAVEAVPLDWELAPLDEPAAADEAPAQDLWDLSETTFDVPAEPREPEDGEPLTWALTPLEEAPSLEPASEALVPLPELEPQRDVTLEEGFALEELNFDSLEDPPVSLDEAEIAALDLPEVELPEAPVPVAAPEAPAERPLSMADVMAAPVQPINPPARDVPPSLLPPPADEEPVDDDLVEVFIEEAGEVLETIGEYLPRWQADTDDREALTEVRRAFHTLKGSGRMVRALIIGELSWSIENLFNRVLDRSIQPSAPLHRVVSDVVALLPELVEEFAARAQRQRDDVDRLAATAHALARGETPPDHEGPPPAPTPSPADGPADAPPGSDTPGTDLASASSSAPEASGSTGASLAAPTDDELDPLLLEIFRNEAENHLDSLVGFLADCAQRLPQPVTDSLQRALHTLKGSAHMAGILPIAEIATPLEKMAKEFKTHLIPMDLPEAELLHEAEQLFRQGLAQLETQPLAPIPGTADLLARIQRRHQERLDSAEAARLGEQGEVRDPQLISIFLAEGMDILLDAGDLLRRWREHPAERQELGALLEELATLGRGAEMAELPQIDGLAQALLDLYGAVEDGRLAVSQRFFDEAEAAHEALIGMMDQVAAGLQVTPQPERVEALRALLDEALDPAALALLEPEGGLQVEELDALPEPSAAPAPLSPSPAPAVVELDEEMVDIFLEEAVDILDSAGQALERWLGDPDNRLVLLSLQRDLHTLKGGARMADIRPVGDLAHELESLYEGLVDHRYGHSPALGDLLQRSHDRLAVLLDELQARRPLAEPRDLIEVIQAFRQGGGLPAPTPARPESISPEEGPPRDESPSDESPDDAPSATRPAPSDTDAGDASALTFAPYEPAILEDLPLPEEDAPAEPGEAAIAEAELADLEDDRPLSAPGLAGLDDLPVLDDASAQADPRDLATDLTLDEVAAPTPIEAGADALTDLAPSDSGLASPDDLPVLDEPTAPLDETTDLILDDVPAPSPVDAHAEAPAWDEAPLGTVADGAPPAEAAPERAGLPDADADAGDGSRPDANEPEAFVRDDGEPLSAAPAEPGLDLADEDEAMAPLDVAEARNEPSPDAPFVLDPPIPDDEIEVGPIVDAGTGPVDAPFDPAFPSLDAEWPEQPLASTPTPDVTLDESLAEEPSETLALDEPGLSEPAEDAVDNDPATPAALAETDRLAEPTEPEATADLQAPATPTEAPTPLSSEPEPWVDDDRDPELVDIFLEEGFDILDSAGASLQRWMGDVDNSLELEALQRDLHTLKGGARMAEIREIGDLAHELEFLYEGLGDGRLRAGPALFALLQDSHDRLVGMLEAVRDHRRVPDGRALIEAIQRFRANPDEQLSVPTSVHLQPSEAPAPRDEEGEADILDIFLEEADDLLEALEGALGRWENARDDGAAVDELLRILHTLKGGARLAGQKRLGDLSHELEQHLTEAQQQGAPWPDSLFVDVQSGFEGLQGELEGLRQRLGESEGAPASAVADAPMAPVLSLPIVAAAQEPPTQPAAPAQVLPFVRRAEEAAQEAATRRAPQELVKVPADLLEGLVNLAGETSIFRGRVEQQVSDFSFTLGEMEATIDRVRDQLRRLDTETQAQILSRYQAEAERAGYEDFDPLEMDRYSQLQQLSRALFESASDLLDLKETLAARNRDAETLLLQQARVNTELQEGLMRTRMVPFDRLVPRLRRIVRQVAGELGKQVEFVVGNAEGEMDRSVLERIVAPLEHMLRNAVDHGIEPVETRRAAGKPDTGTIRLVLGREGGDIVLSLSDDGGGIRLDAVRRKAIERGLLDPQAELPDHEVLQFILEAGFSTAERVTQISGRGVGMDVVHSEVKQLGGSMSIESTPGQGTRFLIRLPFTVSVNRALMVLSGEDLYAIPLNTIEGIVRVSPFELEAYYQPDAPRFEYAGQTYELKYLGDLLNNGQHPKLVGQSLPLPVILVRSAEHAVAVQVDSLAGSREIVVKGLGPQFAGVPGISGATILGDGRVVVILDLLATIRALHAQAVQPLLRSASVPALPAESEHERPTLVMVVDDSVTVRKVTSRLLERNGMNVLTAKDGVDAIAQLQERKPDILLLDIEMPRMDGFEVATLVRHDERLKDLPIIMITSRTGEKHRERAMAIGVNEYLGKPYQESLLLDTIQHLARRP